MSSLSLVLTALRELYRRTGRPIAPAEVYHYLKQSGISISARRVRDSLQKLYIQGYVKRYVYGNRPYYEPLQKEEGRKSPTLLDFLPPVTSERVTGEVEEQEEKEGIHTVARQIFERLKESRYLSSLIEEHAIELADMNPLELAVGLLKTMCLKFYEYSSTLDEERYRTLVDALRTVLSKWYISVLGIPALRLDPSQRESIKDLLNKGKIGIGTLCGRVEELSDIIRSATAVIAYYIEPSIGGRGYSIFAFSEKKLREILLWRFTDDKIIVEEKLKPERDVVHVAGHDTSYWPVRFDPLFFEGRPGPPVEVYVLAGIVFSTWRYSIGTNPQVAAEVIPEPRRLAELHEKEALERGFIIPPELLDEMEGYSKRAVEAAMNILEYSLIKEELNPALREKGLRLGARGTSGPRPQFPPRPVYHDGRLFPYEHKLDDYTTGYSASHSKLVRLSFARFRDVLRDVIGDPSLTVVGVVKRTRSPVLHPLLVYGLYTIGAISSDIELWKQLPRWHYIERYEVEALLRALYTKRGIEKGKTYRTVGVIRRLWAMDKDLVWAFVRPDYGAKNILDEYDEEFWLELAVINSDQLHYGRGLKGYLMFKDVEEPYADETLAYVLAKASVAMTYILPPPDYVNIDHFTKTKYEKLALPRYEVLIAPPNVKQIDVTRMEEAARHYRKRSREVLSRLALPRVRDPKSGIPLFDYDVPEVTESVDGRQFRFLTVVPKHIAEADRVVRAFDYELRTRYYEDLLYVLRNFYHKVNER